MASKKPVVVGADGILEQLQAGDQLDIASAPKQVVTLTNGNAGSLPIGTPCYASGADEFDEAQASAAGTSNLLGILDATTASGSSGDVVMNGTVDALTTEWDAITGQTGGLTVGVEYFLDPASAGMLTTTVPTTGYIVRAGKALSTTRMAVQVEPLRVRL